MGDLYHLLITIVSKIFDLCENLKILNKKIYKIKLIQ